MTYIPNTTLVNNLYPVANGTVSSAPFVDVFLPRDPTTGDINYPVQKKWLNTEDGHYWELEGFISSGGVVLANWIKIASTEHVETLTGNTGGAVGPASNNINVVGDGNYIITTGNPATSTLTISPGGSLTTLYTADTGTATPSSGNLNIFGGTGIDTSASGNTITIAITGGSAVTGFDVDAHTAPGTDPVVPNGSGVVTVTGAQVGAGTTTNVIRTDSLAANAYTIEIQRSQAVASTTVGDNGVSHFYNQNFTVDGNGFVQLNTPITLFTPIVIGATTAGVTTYVFQSGSYVRIGNMVTAQLSVMWSAATGTGDVVITGFPYKFGGAQSRAPISPVYVDSMTWPMGASYLYGRGSDATTIMNVGAVSSGAGETFLQMQATGNINLSITYLTSDPF